MRTAASRRSEEHTSELQSHSGISYAVFCLKKKKYTAGGGMSSRTIIMTYFAITGLVNLVMFFFFNDTAPTKIYTPLYTLSLHDALPISLRGAAPGTIIETCPGAATVVSEVAAR